MAASRAPHFDQPWLDGAGVLEDLLLELLDLPIHNGILDECTERFVAALQTLALYQGEDRLAKIQVSCCVGHLILPRDALFLRALSINIRLAAPGIPGTVSAIMTL